MQKINFDFARLLQPIAQGFLVWGRECRPRTANPRKGPKSDGVARQGDFRSALDGVETCRTALTHPP